MVRKGSPDPGQAGRARTRESARLPHETTVMDMRVRSPVRQRNWVMLTARSCWTLASMRASAAACSAVRPADEASLGL
jgi:hypothetical protein